MVVFLYSRFYECYQLQSILIEVDTFENIIPADSESVVFFLTIFGQGFNFSL